MHRLAREVQQGTYLMEVLIDITSEGSQPVVRLSGRLTGDTVGILREACEEIEGSFVLDLSNLRFADAAAVAATWKLVEKGAVVREASPFIQLLLDDVQEEKMDKREVSGIQETQRKERSHGRP